MTDFYLNIGSQYYQNLFPTNEPSSFTIQLPPKIMLNDRWEAGLVAIRLTLRGDADVSAKDPVIIVCSMCKASYVNGYSLRLLRSITPSSKHVDFSNVQYVKLCTQGDEGYVSFNIIDAGTFRPVSLLAGPSWLTLHVRPLL